ncbi:Pimeloyl-ACP methyl ester carboxylesterase [Flavobacterium succinicans]|uniref:Pimeloyl-ACP methyl ester carboxylesterase n=1 Tax=Flavobacterium succinicans TaxID=29536 RepID=A0A1I4UZK2_9FLAO|nr:alpha/beta hydrolase [Flavobacterium succinicans]SFM94467.1 Pimeloyl-ACP methyl ester carboxylesterase [Flavobacterium succinicans]
MKTLFYKNTSISFSDIGKGTAIVLLHGFLENQSMWNALVPVLSQKYRVITIDLLGHGQTEPLGYIQTMEDNADMVHEVLSSLRLRKAAFIGHSMGGYVALAYAELYPESVKGLVLLNSTAKKDSLERKTNRDRAIKAVKNDYETFIRLSVANLFSEDNRERLSDCIEKVKTEALQTPLQGIVASLEGMKIRKDREVILHTTAFPKLLILGEKDPVLNYEETVAQIQETSVDLVTFPDGHMSHIENETDLAKELVQFLQKI